MQPNWQTHKDTMRKEEVHKCLRGKAVHKLEYLPHHQVPLHHNQSAVLHCCSLIHLFPFTLRLLRFK